MAAAAVRTIQVVKHHVALIKFPQRGGPSLSFIPDYSPTTAVPAAAPQAASSSSAQVAAPTAPLPSTSLAESYQKPVGSTPRGSGIEWDQLPSRYRRRPLDDEEMGYIMRGGPE